MMSNGLAHLAPNDCWALLRTTTVARLAVTTGRGVDIFPVNFVADHGTVVFRTADGTKLAAALDNGPVALEADGVDGVDNLAWSVVIKGRATQISGIPATIDTFDLPLFPWHDAPKNRLIRITPDEITGRRFTVTTPVRWANPLTGVPHTAVE